LAWAANGNILEALSALSVTIPTPFPGGVDDEDSVRGFVTSLMVAGFLLVPGNAKAQDDCQLCGNSGCGETEHDDLYCSGCILGNSDQPHSYWNLTCEAMYGYGVHLLDHSCIGEESPGPLVSLQSLETLSPEEALEFSDAYPRSLVLNQERKVLQVLDCAKEHVIAQFDVERPSTGPQPRGVAGTLGAGVKLLRSVAVGSGPAEALQRK
jgi:hypothetical protein